jgi:ABC-type sugar transport system permease subunit
MGYAAAQTVVLFAILLTISLLQLGPALVEPRDRTGAMSRAGVA